MKHSLVLLTTLASFNMAIAQNEVSCAFTSISADITSNTTLSASTLYRIEGCVRVTSGNTLTIPAGTKIMGEKASKGTLIIEPGAQLIVNGTAANPVVFTSDQTAGKRQPGDWGGLVLLGDAPVNVGSTMTVSKHRICPITAGGTSPSDNSGILQYMRIEYPVYGLTMVGVGSSTSLEHIQVSEASQTSFDIHGGGAELKKLVSLNARRNDVLASAGNQSKGQFILGLRLDANAYVSDGELSNGIVYANNYDSTNSFTSVIGKPDNQPIFSNVSLIGPGYCEESYNSNFQNGILFFQNTKGGIYNSVISGWQNGLLLYGTDVLQQADINYALHFAQNSFYNNTYDYQSVGLWPENCADNFEDWIKGEGDDSCKQEGNQINPSGIGLDNSFCGDLCENRPNLILDSDPLTYRVDPPAYNASALTDIFFETADYRGALDANTDWTADWVSFCAQSNNYCPPAFINGNMGGIIKQSDAFELYPNPAQSIFSVSFTDNEAGKAALRIVDYSGRTVHQHTYPTKKGYNSFSISTAGWTKGIYFVNLYINSKTQTSKIVIE